MDWFLHGFTSSQSSSVVWQAIGQQTLQDHTNAIKHDMRIRKNHMSSIQHTGQETQAHTKDSDTPSFSATAALSGNCAINLCSRHWSLCVLCNMEVLYILFVIQGWFILSLLIPSEGIFMFHITFGLHLHILANFSVTHDKEKFCIFFQYSHSRSNYISV